jgi:MSHA biogenesis protein MshO
MRPIRPERGVTLIELVVTIVIVGIIVAAIAFFLTPLRQSTDLALRAELTDIANNALQRIGRDVKLALPNSVRVTPSSGPPPYYIEFLAIREAGRYRSDSGSVAGGTACDQDDGSLSIADNDQLSFDLSAGVPPGDQCFKTLGLLASPGAVTTNDFLVLNNYGPGFPDQDAYEAGAANRAQVDAAVSSEAGRNRVHFAKTNFSRALHDSPGKRFFVISGPVSYVCDAAAGTMRRHWNYGGGTGSEPVAAQPTTFSSGSSALIAENVIDCSFKYSNVGPQLGLVTMQVSLRRQLFGGSAETVSLYHAVHVSNAP